MNQTLHALSQGSTRPCKPNALLQLPMSQATLTHTKQKRKKLSKVQQPPDFLHDMIVLGHPALHPYPYPPPHQLPQFHPPSHIHTEKLPLPLPEPLRAMHRMIQGKTSSRRKRRIPWKCPRRQLRRPTTTIEKVLRATASRANHAQQTTLVGKHPRPWHTPSSPTKIVSMMNRAI
jgi:hypothetical protein